MKFRLYLPALCALLVSAAPLPRDRTTAITLVGFQAKLYYGSTGTFSRDILADSSFALWNTIIGAGDAEAPSNATLVLVELGGEAGSYGSRTSVRLHAVVGSRVLVNRATRLSEFGPNGRQFAAFWIYETGCETIDLTATVSDVAEPLRARIPFACGE